jgi:hypothetical protein
MIIPGKFGFNCPSSRHFPFYIGTKNLNFVEDHPMNIPATAGHRLTLDPSPCKQIPVFPVFDRP